MELKDVILSTLAEMEDIPPESKHKFEVKEKIELKTIVEKEIPVKKEIASEDLKMEAEISTVKTDSELMYLNSIKERLLVLFEGFQSPNNSNIEVKIDMTLNYLEYVLATVTQRIEKLEKGGDK